MTTAEASPADPTLQADVMSEIKQAQEATDKVKAKREQAAADMFQLYANLLFVVGRLYMYRTYVLLYRTYVLLARLTKVRR